MTISNVGKSVRGRPRVDATPVTVRIPPDQLAPLDAWISVQPKPHPSRPEAIRRLLEGALAEPPPSPFDHLIGLLNKHWSDRSDNDLLDILDEIIALTGDGNAESEGYVRSIYADYLNAQLAPAPEPLPGPKPGM